MINYVVDIFLLAHYEIFEFIRPVLLRSATSSSIVLRSVINRSVRRFRLLKGPLQNTFQTCHLALWVAHLSLSTFSLYVRARVLGSLLVYLNGLFNANQTIHKIISILHQINHIF